MLTNPLLLVYQMCFGSTANASHSFSLMLAVITLVLTLSLCLPVCLSLCRSVCLSVSFFPYLSPCLSLSVLNSAFPCSLSLSLIAVFLLCCIPAFMELHQEDKVVSKPFSVFPLDCLSYYKHRSSKRCHDIYTHTVVKTNLKPAPD